MSIQNPSKDRHAFRVSLLSPRYWLTWIGLGLFFIVTFLPMPVIDWLGCRLGNFAARSNKKRFGIVRTNLSLCFPDKSNSEIEEMVNLFGVTIVGYNASQTYFPSDGGDQFILYSDRTSQPYTLGA